MRPEANNRADIKTPNRIRGFTLIEMSIVVTIAGLLLAAWIQAYDRYLISKSAEETKEKMDMIDDAMSEFYGRNGRYPCPADPSLDPGHPSYGLEQCRNAPFIGEPCAPLNVDLFDPKIVCGDAFGRDADNADGDNNPATGRDPVLIGALPIMTLVNNKQDVDILAKHGYDGWENKFTYLVSEYMADPSLIVETPANVALGAIDLIDENSRSITQPASSAHWVLISHGRNGMGAITRDGEDLGGCFNSVTTLPLPPATNSIGTAGVSPEMENCDNTDAIVVKGLQYHTDDDNSYDDIVYFKASGSQSLWSFSLFSPTGEAWYYNTNLGDVGVETTDPADALDVVGNFHAEGRFEASGNAMGHYCDPSETYCVDVTYFSDSTYDDCPDGEAAVGIENNTLICKPVAFTAPVSQTCPAGEYVYAISNLGNILCESP